MPSRLGQHAASTARCWAAKKRRRGRPPGRAQPRRALPPQRHRHRGHARRRRAGAFAVGKHVQIGQARSPARKRAFRRTAHRSRSGSRRSGRRRCAMPGRSAGAPARSPRARRRADAGASSASASGRCRPATTDADAASAAVPRRSAATGRRRSRPDRARRSRSRGSSGTSASSRRTSCRRGSARPGRSAAVARDIHPGQHHLPVARRDQRAHLGDHGADRHAAAGAAAERDDAEGAAMIAALLHLHEGARAAGELGDQMRGRSRGAAMMSDDGIAGAGGPAARRAASPRCPAPGSRPAGRARPPGRSARRSR